MTAERRAGGSAAARPPAPRWLPVLGLPLGAAAALSLPPLNILPALLAFAVLLLLLRRARSRLGAFAVGWWFGFGWFGVGLYWVAIAFYADAERFGALAVPATVLLCAGLALFHGLATLAVASVRWLSARAEALALAVALMLAELARGSPGLSFPWNPVALAWSGQVPVLQAIAWIGQTGLGLVTLVAAILPATLLSARGRRRWVLPALAVAGLVGLYAAGRARLLEAPPTPLDAPVVRVVQGNVPQELKWDAARRQEWFLRYIALSQAGDSTPQVVVWPETAVPFLLEREADGRAALATAVPPGGWLLTGGNSYDDSVDPPVAHNSLFAVDAEGRLHARYDKVDLVPFGEFLPLRHILERIGLERLAVGSIDFSPGPGRMTIALPGLPPFSGLICYEAIFPRAATAGTARPGWLVNVTNDAWFGRSSGPHQHLAMARLRAIEEGVPLVRAANTGISAIVDSHGRVVAELGLGRTGTLEAALPPALPLPPPIRAWGGWITLGLFALVASASAALEARAQARRQRGLARKKGVAAVAARADAG